MTGGAAPDFEGMTLNERLIVAGQLDAWDAAVAARDKLEIVRILELLAVTDPVKAAAEILGFS